MQRHVFAVVTTLAILQAGAGRLLAAQPQVVATSPAANAMAPADTAISITFDQPLLTSSVTATSLRVFAKQTGRATGSITFSDADQTVTFTPSRAFAAGELVLVNLANTIQAADTTPLRTAGWAFQFLVQTQPAARVFDAIQTQSNKTGAQTRIYGAAAADLDGDGWIDLTTVNEVSADLRVFMNRGDGSGLYKPVKLPPFPIGVESSPNETGDFDQDGKMDLAVSAAQGDGVWIARGAGNGTFSGAQVVPTGNEAHGVAVLDVDGDADLDIVDALAGDNEMAVLLNDGGGTFGSPTYFDSGCSGEWGLASGDLDGDGITDLVVGCVGDQQIGVMLGNGDGTFTVLPSQVAGGSPWQVALGDLDGDGDLDATLADAYQSFGGAVLLGNGDGTFGAPTLVDTGGHAPATDLGDLDGDGDLDWLLSGFGGGLWKLYVNDGAGNFTFDQEFAATANPSCAVLLDVDNDGDLDMALTDEIDDTVTIVQNTNGPSPLCPSSPATCRGSATSGKSSLLMKDKSSDKSDRLAWKWAAGLATPKGDYGAPLGADDYAVCLYDQGALLTSVTADGGGLCAGRPCWTEKPTSFVYRDRELTPTGVQVLQLVEGQTDGKARIKLKARGIPLVLPDLDGLVGPIDVQLQRSGGGPCFGSTFSAPFQKNDGATFKDRAD
jgi:hypothetical protein